MANLNVKDANGTSKFMKTSGAGTDVDPHVSSVSLYDRLDPTNDQVGLGATAANGAQLSTVLSAASNNATNLKNSAGTLYSLRVTNYNTSAARHLKLYNKASTPAPATDTPFDVICVPAAVSSTQPSVVTWSGPAVGVAMGTGIGYAIVAGSGDTDNTSVGAGDVRASIVWK